MNYYFESGLSRRKKSRIDWKLIGIFAAAFVLLPFVALVFYVSILPHSAKADELHYTAVIKEGAYLSPKTFCNSI